MSEAGVITTTEGVVLSEKKATVSTFSLSSAFKGLAASLGITTTALSVITGALAAVAVGAIAYKKWADYQEELRQSAYDTANALDEQNKSVDSYVERYKELRTALQNAKGDEEATYVIKQDLLTLQNELNDTFGKEYGKLNLVTDAYKDQTDAIKQYNKELAQSYLNEHESAINTAKSKMESNEHYNLTYTGEILNSDRGAILKEIAESYKDRGVSILDELGDGTYAQFSIHLNANAEDAQDVVNDFMNDVREKANELNDEDLLADVLEISSSSLNQSKNIIDEYGDIYKKALLSEIATNDWLSTGYNQITQAVESYNEAVLKSEDPYNDNNVKNAWNNLQTIKQGIKENVDVWGKYESVTTEAFEQANDSVYSFYQALQNDDSISKLTDDLKGLSDTDLQSMASDGNQDSFDKLVESAEKYGLEVNDVIDTLIRLGYVQGEVVNEDPFVTNTISLDDLNNQIDSIQSAYKGLTTACEEYNQHGYITADTLQTLLALDSEYLACLINENGQLAINGQTYQALVQAKLADAEATAVQQAIEELGTITTEQQIQADTTAIGVMAEKGTALATLTGQYASLANVAISAAEAQALADAYTDASGKNKEEADRVMSNLNAKLTLIQSTAQNTSGSFGALTNHLNGFSNASKGASKSTDALTESMKKQKEALEKQKDELEKQKQYYEDVSEAVNWFYDKQIEKQEKFIDGLEKENELLEERLNDYDGALSAIDRYYEKQIEGLEKQKDALEGNNKEAEIAIELEKRQQELREARNRKSVNLYEKGKGFVYTTDSSAIRDAEENLADAQRQKEEYDIDAQIEKLKEYQKLWSEIPSVKEKAEEDSQMIALLGAEWESILLEGRIQNISSFKDQYIGLQQQIDNNEGLIASYEEKITYYESLKEQWDALTSRYEEDTYRQLLIGEFGNDYENILLNGRTERWEQFADDYYNIQVELKDVTDQIEALAKRMEEYASKIESAANDAVNAITTLANTPIPDVPSGDNTVLPGGGINVASRYAKGTRSAKKGIAEVGEEGSEIITDGKNVFLAETPTLVNMQGGETVYNANETEQILASKGLKPLDESFLRDIATLKSTMPLDNFATNLNYSVPKFDFPKYNFSDLNTSNRGRQTILEFKGDIVVQGVQDPDGLARAIKTKLPMAMQQELYKR